MRLGQFETNRLILRPFRKSDYKSWYESYVECGPAKNKWDHGPQEAVKYSEKRFAKMLIRLRQLAKDDDYYRLGAFLKTTGELVGHIDFDIFVRSTHQFANFGYMLHNRHWGLGYGQEATREGLKIGFEQLKLNRLEAAINLDNRRSVKLVKAIGMKREGIKKRYWFENGEWVDHLIFVANPEDVGLRPHKPR